MMIQHFMIRDIVQVLKEGLYGLKVIFFSGRRDRYGYIHSTAKVYQPTMIAKSNVYMYENSVINPFSKILTHKGKFVMKRNCRAAAGLTVIAQNHVYINIGDYPGGEHWGNEIANDVICEEDVWLGANVTLCPGVHVGRGSIVAAGSVCIRTKEYPPYSIIGGNPAKFIKFRFTLEEVLEHEKLRFSEAEQLPESTLKEIYRRFS